MAVDASLAGPGGYGEKNKKRGSLFSPWHFLPYSIITLTFSFIMCMIQTNLQPEMFRKASLDRFYRDLSHSREVVFEKSVSYYPPSN